MGTNLLDFSNIYKNVVWTGVNACGLIVFCADWCCAPGVHLEMKKPRRSGASMGLTRTFVVGDTGLEPMTSTV